MHINKVEVSFVGCERIFNCRYSLLRTDTDRGGVRPVRGTPLYSASHNTLYVATILCMSPQFLRPLFQLCRSRDPIGQKETAHWRRGSKRSKHYMPTCQQYLEFLRSSPRIPKNSDHKAFSNLHSHAFLSLLSVPFPVILLGTKWST